MLNLRLICLDFDGTIMVYDEEPGFFHPGVIDALNELAGRGIQWCTNSGRNKESQLIILEKTRPRGLQHMPVALLCSECMIYEKKNGHYVAQEPWNTSTMVSLRQFHAGLQELLKPRLDVWNEKYRPTVYLGDTHSVFFLSEEGDHLVRFMEELRPVVANQPKSMVTRNAGWINIMPNHLGKGNTLRGFLELKGIRPEEALAVGDHYNDLSMLDGSAARHVGCPANAMPDVAAAIRSAGGCVATKDGPEGTLEIIRHYLDQAR
jgi:hydroxymethylpyrimidine pyrophosphatase-like HAD family hydrolase